MHEKFLRIGDFENGHFWKTDILDFFFSEKKKKKNCLILMKISPNLHGRMDGLKFWCFLWFPENSLLCVILRYTVYQTIPFLFSYHIFLSKSSLTLYFVSSANSSPLISILPSFHFGSLVQESDKAQTSLALTEFSKNTVNAWPSPPGCRKKKVKIGFLGKKKF